MDYFEFYKELYHKENERKSQITNSFNIPIALNSAISTAIFFFITSFDYSVEPYLSYTFITLTMLNCGCIAISIYNLIHAFSDFTKGYEYTGIAYVQQLFNWREELEDYHKENKATQPKKKADKDFESFLINDFVDHIDHNMYVNDRKSQFIFKSKRWVVLALVSVLITSLPFGYNFFNKEDKAHQVQIIKSLSQNADSITNSKIDSLTHQINKLNLRYEEQKADTTTTTSKKNN